MIDGKKTIALLGQPNSGKSTLFNGLTGLHQHVGNWPGKTVEKKEGSFTRNGEEYLVADLPGTYSLSANSDEEIITRDYIASGDADVVCILADSSQLERSLFMLADYAGLPVPCFLVLNMADVAADQGKTIDAKALEAKLGIPVVAMSAIDIKNYDGFYAALDRALSERTTIDTAGLEEAYRAIEGFSAIEEAIPEDLLSGYSPLWLAAKTMEGDEVVIAKVTNALPAEQGKAFSDLAGATDKGALQTGQAKFAWIDSLLQGAATQAATEIHFSKFDRAITSKRWGKLVVVAVVIAGLFASFIPAMPLMGIGMGISALNGMLMQALTDAGVPALAVGILCEVVIQSLAFIVQMLGFVFGVTLVFGFLEEIGVMARISYVFDNTMAKMGLQGKSIMPFLVSFGCTMGGAAGARVIDNWGQKVLTIALAWAVPCGAAWAIVPMLSMVFFGAWAPTIIAAILIVMLLHMWITSKVFGGRLVAEEDRYGIIMELPPYHKPKWGALLRYVLGRTKDTFFRVTKVVVLICAVFWLLSYAPGGIEASVLYKIGTAIEPVTKIFGLTWPLFMAFIASSVGKEGAVGVLSALYTGTGSLFAMTAGGGEVAANINELLVANVPMANALAFIFAITFNVPCVVAMAATYQETHSAKWTGIIAGYYTVGALLLAFLAYQVGLLIW